MHYGVLITFNIKNYTSNLHISFAIFLTLPTLTPFSGCTYISGQCKNVHTCTCMHGIQLYPIPNLTPNFYIINECHFFHCFVTVTEETFLFLFMEWLFLKPLKLQKIHIYGVSCVHALFEGYRECAVIV